MEEKVLVAYATKYGSTKEIAEKIGQTLTESGLAVEVAAVGKVADIAQYKAIVAGSGIYIGQWRKDAVKFILDNEKVLSEKPVWFFSSGPTSYNDDTGYTDNAKLPKKLFEVVERIKPRDIAVFKGFVDPKKVDGLSKWIIKRIHVNEADNPEKGIGDYRDWDNITNWAKTITLSLGKSEF